MHSTQNSSILASLVELLKANGQQDLQRNLEFEELKHAGSEVLKELEGIQALHNNVVQNEEKRDSATAASLKNLSTKLDDLVTFGHKLSTEHLILESLRYRSMAIRHERIVDAHARTFEWIYHSYRVDKEPQYERLFVDWLAHNNGFFWITGKAGSGKSTLMKFLSHHEETERFLQLWSGQQRLVVASFYFWYAGTALQKSQEGLLRSLLYEILGNCPNSIPVAVPKRWERALYSHSSSSDWTYTELVATLNSLISQPTLQMKFCFFIDGLDEYDGDHGNLIELMQQFTRSLNIKLCVSSRPWNVFEAAFGNCMCPRLYLEDLTREDIKRYVRDKLEGNNGFRKLRRSESENCEQLVNDIVQKAYGVFLWVFLTVRSLTSGLENADRIVDLQRRLDSLPSDLEEFFQHMLDTIDPNYSQQTAQTFQVALEAAEPLTLMTYFMLDELELNPDFALSLETQVMPGSEIRSRHDDMKLRINARCKDLLQAKRIIRHVDESGPDLSARDNLPASFSDYQVDFLHRTVRDFFHIKRIYDWVEAHVSRDFDYNQSLCAAFLAQIKTTSFHTEIDFEIQTLLDFFVGMGHYAHGVEVRIGVSPTALLDSLLNIVACHHKAIKECEERQSRGAQVELVSIELLLSEPFAFLVHHELQLYVAEKLDNHWGHVSLDQEGTALIWAALNPYHPSREKRAGPKHNDEMLHLLISKGVYISWEELQLEPCRIACNKVYSSWADMAHNLSNTQIEQSGSLTGSTASFAQGPRILQWVMRVLKSLNSWCHFWAPFKEESFVEFLTDIIETVLQRGVSPNWRYGKCTPWIYFVVSLSKHKLSAKSQCTLKLAKEFLRHGALLDQDMSVAFHEISRNETDTEIPWDGSVQLGEEKITAHELLQKVFSEEQMKELASVERAEKNRPPQSAEKREGKQKEKKKRRKKRRQAEKSHQ